MHIYLPLILLFVICFSLHDQNVSCLSRGGGGRGGGSRSGGSRSGGSRSGYRSGSSFRSGSVKSRSIYSSSRYNSWSVRVGVRSSVRYRVSPWGDQHRAILMGYIVMSSHQRSRFHMSDQSYYSSISICYNEEPLYERNVTASPWFVCPWNDYDERYCCGSEVEERCCRYFERTGHKAGLIIGIMLLILLIFAIFFMYRRSHKAEKEGVIVYAPQFKDGDKSDSELIEGSPLIVYPPMNNGMPSNELPYPTNPPYPTGSGPVDNGVPYPTGPPQPMSNNTPYPVGPAPSGFDSSYPPQPGPMGDNLPYPTNPGYNAMAPGIPGGGWQNAPPNNDNAPYGNPPATMPPSY